MGIEVEEHVTFRRTAFSAPRLKLIPNNGHWLIIIAAQQRACEVVHFSDITIPPRFCGDERRRKGGKDCGGGERGSTMLASSLATKTVGKSRTRFCLPYECRLRSLPMAKAVKTPAQQSARPNQVMA